eukprot:1102722-Pelagomonas_calceolata.AAC.4
MLVQRRTKKFEAQTVSWPVYGDKPLNNHGSVPAWTHPVRRIARRSTWSLSTHGIGQEARKQLPYERKGILGTKASAAHLERVCEAACTQAGENCSVHGAVRAGGAGQSVVHLTDIEVAEEGQCIVKRQQAYLAAMAVVHGYEWDKTRAAQHGCQLGQGITPPSQSERDTIPPPRDATPRVQSDNHSAVIIAGYASGGVGRSQVGSVGIAVDAGPPEARRGAHTRLRGRTRWGTYTWGTSAPHAVPELDNCPISLDMLIHIAGHADLNSIVALRRA